jgi:hypothetical protein
VKFAMSSWFIGDLLSCAEIVSVSTNSSPNFDDCPDVSS